MSREGGTRVAVLLCGYGEPEDHGSFGDWNELSLRLLVAESIPLPERAIVFRVHLDEVTGREARSK